MVHTNQLLKGGFGSSWLIGMHGQGQFALNVGGTSCRLFSRVASVQWVNIHEQSSTKIQTVNHYFWTEGAKKTSHINSSFSTQLSFTNCTQGTIGTAQGLSAGQLGSGHAQDLVAVLKKGFLWDCSVFWNDL